MTLILTIDDHLEERLTREADAQGLSLEQYALRILGERGESRATRGRDLVERWRRDGVIGSRPDIEDSAAYARRLRREAERRHGRDAS